MARRLSLSAGRGLALVAAVLALHVLVTQQLAQTVSAWSDEAAAPARLQVAYVREMLPSEPPPGPRAAPTAFTAAAPARAPRAPVDPRIAAPPDPEAAAKAASAPPPEPLPEPQPVPEPPAALVVTTPEPASAAADTTLATTVPASTAPTEVASAAGSSPAMALSTLPDAPPFAWPASTRLSYRLSGQYRGEVQGRAQVEWVLAAPRYQVHLDVSVGLPMAPLFTRKMSSDGRLTASGLRPERYDELSKMAFRDRKLQQVTMDDEGVRLADGSRWTAPLMAAPGTPPDGVAAHTVASSAVQDSASQFVQLSYLFTVQPELLAPGRTIGFPLALPRRVEPWVYEVVGTETQYTPFGPLETFHVRPRRGTPRGNDLLAEAWFAPQLAYLPVRIRIEQDAEVFIDLVLDRRPELASR